MKQPTLLQKALAWSVHIFTSSGLLAAFMAILAITASDFRAAMLWLLLAYFIDSVDGAFARLFRVKEVLPYMDGKTIDFVIDFATYAIIPAFFLYEANIVGENWRLPCAFIMLLVAALYYGKDGMVSDDMYFVGFPVVWNWVVFYMYFVFELPHKLNAFLIFVFAALHFIPVKFAYPSQARRLKWLSISVALLFLASIIGLVYYHPVQPLWAFGAAVFTIFYFGGLAIYDTYIWR